MATYRHLEITKHGDVSVVRFVPPALLGDLETKVGEELDSVATEEGCTKLLLNLSGVQFLSSQVLGKLILLHKRMKEKGGNLKLSDVSPNLRPIFGITRLNKILDIRDTEASALDSFGGPSVPGIKE